MNVNRLDDHGMTALLYMIQSYLVGINDYESLNSDVSSRTLSDSNEDTELLTSIQRDALDCVELLLSAGANPNIRNRDGMTCLHILAAVSHSYVSFYKQNSVTESRKSKQDSTQKCLQCFKKNKLFSCAYFQSSTRFITKILERLLQEGADPNVDNYSDVSIANVFVQHCMQLLPVLRKSGYLENNKYHVPIEFIKVLHQYGCQYFVKFAEKKSCWFNHILHKLGKMRFLF